MHTWTDEGHFYSPPPPMSGDNEMPGLSYPLFANGAGAFRIGKNSVVLTNFMKKTLFYAYMKFLLSD